jgi:hypothetical protein
MVKYIIIILVLLSFQAEGQIIRANPFYTSRGVVVVSTDTLLLDSFPNATLAYSFRKLKTGYTGNAIRVRRASDNTEQDVSYVNNYLDTTSLKTFCSATNCFITTWFSQGDSTRNATQTTAANQPRIVNNGALDIQNGKVTAIYDGTDFFNITSIAPADSSYSAFGIGRSNLTTNNITFFGRATSGTNITLARISGRYYFQKSTAYLESTATDNTNAQILLSGISGASIFKQYKNGSEISSSTVRITINNTITAIGRYNNAQLTNGQIQELIIYFANKDSDRTGIERMINRFYSIY